MTEMDTEDEPFEGSNKRYRRADLETVTIESDDIPLRGSPDEFLILIDELKGTGTRQIGELNEEIDDFGSTNMSANVKYGENLGFIERTPDGIILTEEGVELAYAHENGDDLSNLFKVGLQQEDSYLALLLEFEGDSDYQSLIKNSDLLQVMYQNHDLREEKDTVLKRAASILFETLELAGYGEMKEAGGDYPRRFSFSDSWNTDSAISELVIDESKGEDFSVDNAASDSQDGESEEPETRDISPDQQSEQESDGEDAIDEGAASEEGPEVPSGNGERGRAEKLEKEDSGEQEVVIDINLHIDVNEMDSAELGKKIEHINKLIR